MTQKYHVKSHVKKGIIREYVEAIVVAVLIALCLRSFVIEAFKIPSGSMIPTLKIGDHIFVNKFIYGLRIPYTKIRFFQFRTPKRGEVIVFIFPNDNSKDYIKRVVGTPGDTLEMKQGTLFINGEPVSVNSLQQQILFSPDEFTAQVWRDGEKIDILVRKKTLD